MNLRGAVRGALPAAGLLAGLALLVLVAAPHWDSVRASGSRLAPGWIVLAASSLAVHYAIAFAIWFGCLRAAGATPPIRSVVDTWVPSLLARYVPGKVWSHGIRVALARRAGVALGDVTGAVGWEVLLAVTSAGVVAMLALSRSALDVRIRVATIAFTATCVVLMVVARGLSTRDRLPYVLRKLGMGEASTRTLIMLVGAHMAGWLVYGIAHWALARALVPLAPSELALVTGAVALAWIGGYLSFFTPAGLGVREGLLTLLLGPLLGPGPVVVVAALSRLLSIALEVVLFAGWGFRRGSGSRAGPRPKEPVP